MTLDRDKQQTKKLLEILIPRGELTDEDGAKYNNDSVWSLIEAYADERVVEELQNIADNFEAQHTVKFGTVIKWSDVKDRIGELTKTEDKK